jgi:hypothetical protein
MTLLYSTHDTEHNNAVAWQACLEAKLKERRRSMRAGRITLSVIVAPLCLDVERG